MEGVDALLQTGTSKHSRRQTSMGMVVEYFRNNKLQLINAEIEGGHVVVPTGMFTGKARAAAHKNLIPAKLEQQKVNSAAVLRCKTLELNKGPACGYFFLPRPTKTGFCFDVLSVKMGAGKGS